MKLLVYFAVTAVSLSLTVPALADTVVTTPTIIATLANGSTATGTVSFDTTTDTVVGLNFTVGSDSFTTLHFAGTDSGDTEYYFDSETSSGMLLIGLPVGETGLLASGGVTNYCVSGSGCDFTSFFMPTGGAASQFTAVTTTPEPSSLILLGTGALGLLGAARRRFVRA